MARGWESKAVEAQQDEASRRSPTSTRRLTPEDRALLDRRKTLELARARTLADLQSTLSSPHRTMLESALKALDEQLQKLA